MDTTSRKSLLIIYDYFYPGFRAGGPIQSLTNLVNSIHNNYNISVITSSYDLHHDVPYDTVRVNEWNKINLPGNIISINIWYADKNLDLKQIKELLLALKPDIIYLNGLFSYRFFILPLLAIHKLQRLPKLVICPRGMLQSGALEGKQLKKKVYITALKITGLLKTSWHATNGEECEDIKRIFGNKQHVVIAFNIPKKPLKIISFPQKQQGKLRLVYLSLIAEKKNLLFLLEMLKACPDVTLDIYGPVKDMSYWESCKAIINGMSGKVVYKGEAEPSKVQLILEEYDAFILLTKGENFGHALYESLSAGRPLITSNFTPWTDLQDQKAGWNIEISNKSEGITLLRNLRNMSPDIFNEYCEGAHELATKYYSQLRTVEEYTRLFN